MPDNGPSVVTEYDYATLIALGELKPAVSALKDASDLLDAVEHPSASELRTALVVVARVQIRLSEERG